MMSTIRRPKGVTKRTWNKWSATARHVFHATYAAMRANQRLFTHPGADKVSAKHWSTVAFNAAWWAADEVRRFEKGAS